MTDPAPRGRLRLTSPFAYYGPYILGGLLGIVANRFEWHQGLKLYLAAPLAVAGCIYFDRKRRARAKDAYSAQAELERRAADRLQSHDDFYPRS